MTADDSKVTIHMVASLDGYIVDKDGGVAWLDTHDRYEAGVAHEDPTPFLETIGCWVIGSRTYEHALRLGWPYGDKPTFVLTSRSLASDRASVRFRSGDLRHLVDRELRPQYRSIWVCGGSVLVKSFLQLGLADRLCVTIAPAMIGDGLPFFDRIGVARALHLEDVKAYESGIVELTYEIVRG